MTDADRDAARADRDLHASLTHDEWCNSLRRAGWRYGPVLDLPGLQHPDLVPFDQLPDQRQAAYRRQAGATQ